MIHATSGQEVGRKRVSLLADPENIRCALELRWRSLSLPSQEQPAESEQGKD